MLSVVVLTNRRTVGKFFEILGPATTDDLDICRLPLSVRTAEDFNRQLLQVAVAIIDAAPNPELAIDVCQCLHTHRPTLPIVVVVWCPRAISSSQLRGLDATGVYSFIDLDLGRSQIRQVLREVTRGARVVRAESNHEDTALAEEGRPGPISGEPGLPTDIAQSDLDLLRLLANGSSDREMADRLYLSRHTVKHHIERLRDRAGARNRTHLAAWAGHQGLYSKDQR
ncbi:MAG: hypothetical protein GEU73_12205 [Chloroflexi bacterium]|nr:hypothetical protein [Chloroflexota bacterium]